jgi:hypothetical protein
MAKEVKDLLIDQMHGRGLAWLAKRYASGQTFHDKSNVANFGIFYGIQAEDRSVDSVSCDAVLEHREGAKSTHCEYMCVLKLSVNSASQEDIRN